MNKVMIHPAGLDTCGEAVDHAFELFPLEVSGKKVMVKPNALRASDADQGVVTHPALVKAVVDKLETLSPRSIVVGDNPGMMSYGANEKTFEQTGLMTAAGKYYRNIGTDVVQVDFNPKFIERLGVSRAVMEADVVISLPKFKTHGLTVISGAVKNSYGFIPGAMKANLHRIAGDSVRFSEVLVDIYRLKVPHLIIVDAIVGMEGNGPASTELRQVNRILAADNGIALDATIARMMGVKPESLPFLKIARQQNLGEFDESAIEILGQLEPIPNFKLPPSAKTAGDVPTGEGAFFESRIRLRPKADKNLCTACGSCIDQCPVSALSMVDNLPVVDPDVCITCFCCQEMCPEMAIKLV